ncbi:MAG TPA: L-lysine 6-transaminase [Edaphocola sp.]|nr:L-lysine 6-transaminase [Edaphocola sp.]
MEANKVNEILGKHILADGYNLVMDFEKSYGSYIVDKLSGNEILDMFSMFASSAVGYNHPYILEHEAWLGKYTTFKPTLSDVYFEEYAEFMQVFERVAIPKELSYCFFIDGGALAVENALKAAFDWKTRKNWLKNSKDEGSVVIHFEQAFHGRSGYTLSLTNTADPRKYQYFPKFDWPRIVNPKLQFPITEDNLKTTVALEEKAIAQINEAIQKHGDKVACIIIEPIQCEGGDNQFRKEFLQQLRAICDQNEILLIFDEVQVGMGITGKMWAYQLLGVTPDIISFGKKTQVCGILASKEKMNEVAHHVFTESSRINSTFGGNFIDYLRLKLILEIFEKDNLLDNVRQQGERLLSGLQALQNKFPNLISNARGRGLLCAFDLPSGELRDKVVGNLMKEERVLILSSGTQSVRFRPQLVVTAEEIDLALAAIERVVGKM